MLQQFLLKKSNSSCNISDITGFIYGPFSSRFWVMRKYISMKEPHKLKIPGEVPFNAWDCITL